jgi:hypothetical protein
VRTWHTKGKKGCYLRLAKIVTVALTFFCLPCPSLGQGQDRFAGWCNGLELAASPYLVEFLSGVVPDEKNARCVTWAIHRLGNERYAPAVAALVKLLDFHRPPTEDEKLGVFLRPSLIGEMFPAAESLEQIGASAQAEVLHAIGSDSVSATARENAIAVWMEIHKYARPKGVALLKLEANKPSAAAAKQKFRIAARMAVKYCIGMPEQPACETAAKTGRFD